MKLRRWTSLFPQIETNRTEYPIDKYRCFVDKWLAFMPHNPGVPGSNPGAAATMSPGKMGAIAPAMDTHKKKVNMVLNRNDERMKENENVSNSCFMDIFLRKVKL